MKDPLAIFGLGMALSALYAVIKKRARFFITAYNALSAIPRPKMARGSFIIFVPQKTKEGANKAVIAIFPAYAGNSYANTMKIFQLPIKHNSDITRAIGKYVPKQNIPINPAILNILIIPGENG